MVTINWRQIMKIDNNLTTNKTNFKANFIAKFDSARISEVLPELQKMCKKIPGTEGDTILFTEINSDSDLHSAHIFGLFDYFKQGNPKSVLSQDTFIGHKDGRQIILHEDTGLWLKTTLSELADRIKRLPEQYGG